MKWYYPVYILFDIVIFLRLSVSYRFPEKTFHFNYPNYFTVICMCKHFPAEFSGPRDCRSGTRRIFSGQLIYSLFFIFSNTVIVGKNPNFLKKSDAFSLPVLTKNPVSHRAAFIRPWKSPDYQGPANTLRSICPLDPGKQNGMECTAIKGEPHFAYSVR